MQTDLNALARLGLYSLVFIFLLGFVFFGLLIIPGRTVQLLKKSTIIRNIIFDLFKITIFIT